MVDRPNCTRFGIPRDPRRRFSSRANDPDRAAASPSYADMCIGVIAPSFEAATQEDEVPAVFGHPNKRCKVGSFFHHERTGALHPSLVYPTSPVEQANNIFHAQDIGKLYQLNVKDYQIQVRDDRIKAKDKEIAELASKVESMDSLVSVINSRVHDLSMKTGLKSLIIRDLSRDNTTLHEQNKDLQQDIYNADGTIQHQDALLRRLHRELQSSKAELQNLKDKQLCDHILGFIRGILGWAEPQDTPAKFPLMRLPGELRNMIYTHSLVLHRPIDFWPMHPGNGHATNIRCTNVAQDLQQINGNLLRVSRQVHKETVGILYGCNRFRFSHYGSWTVMNGFLSHINSNCQYLSNISVKIPDCWARVVDDRRPLELRLAMDIDGLTAIFKRFGGISLETDSPTGESLNVHKSFARGCEILANLPALKNFSLVVPHNEEIYQPAAKYIANILTPDDRTLMVGDEPASSPKRALVFLQRPDWMSPMVGPRNMDDDVFMGRAKLLEVRNGAEIKYGVYGGDRVSYTVNGGEEEFDIDVPDYIEQPGASGSVLLQLFRAAKKLLGY